jgi:phosphatidylserine/phosphatidylglycerophosphate/cardiolipin synthase-like enzyme
VEGRPYFPAPTGECPTYVENTEWLPLVDGAAYLPELADRLSELDAGDSLVIHGFEFDARLDLRGLQPGDPGYLSLGQRLAQLAADGVDVRIVLAGQRAAALLPVPALAGFRRNVAIARGLQRYRPPGWPAANPPPLQGKVLLDKSGPVVGSNHLKSVALIRRGSVTAFVGGIDLTLSRYDEQPHERMRRHGSAWGWHDAVVRLRGPAAARAHAVLAERWTATAARARRFHRVLPFTRLRVASSPVPAAPMQEAVDGQGTEVRVLRSAPPRPSWLLRRRVPNVAEVFETLTSALQAAQRYVYIEDQYLGEQAGGHSDYELYPFLFDAAARGVKLIFVGSGVRDSDDPGIHLRPINRSINRDLQQKVIDRLPPEHRDNVTVHRVARVTVHAKIVLIDDEFACIGSANMFSRSMSGTDRELSTAIMTTTSLVRDLRVRLWAEHLRTPVPETLRPALENLDISLGIWRTSWSAASARYWREPGSPPGFAPGRRALIPVPQRRSLLARLHR